MKASFLDWIFITITIVVFFLITIFNSTKDTIWSTALTLVLVIAYLFVLITWRSGIRAKKIGKINEAMGEEKITKRIEKLNNNDFLLYMKDLLEEYYNTKLFKHYGHIDFTGEINEDIYGIKCIKTTSGGKVDYQDIENYIEDMKNNDIDEGIIISNSYFTEKVKQNPYYILIDFDYMKGILKKIGQFPIGEEIEDMIIERYKSEKGTLEEKLGLPMKNKIYKFILLGIVLYLVSAFVSYPLYYRIMAFVLISVGIIIGVYNVILYLRTKKGIKVLK